MFPIDGNGAHLDTRRVTTENAFLNALTTLVGQRG